LGVLREASHLSKEKSFAKKSEQRIAGLVNGCRQRRVKRNWENKIIIGNWIVRTLLHPGKIQELAHKNTINYVKAQRLGWFGHLYRIPEERMAKKSIQVETDVKKTTRETKEQTGR
jgi:hypothetical protein